MGRRLTPGSTLGHTAPEDMHFKDVGDSKAGWEHNLQLVRSYAPVRLMQMRYALGPH